MRQIKQFNFYSVKSLSKHLGVPEDVLIKFSEDQQKHYRFFENIPDKKKNKLRNFYVADDALGSILKRIDKKILDRINWPKNFVGGIKGRSLRINALMHLNKKSILKLDIKDFYPSISPMMVEKSLASLGIRNEPLKILTNLVTVSHGMPHLPQGFCTSPKLAALVLQPIDRRFHGLELKHNITYSFWIDDITISGCFPVKRLKKLVTRIVNDHGFESHKFEILNQNDRMVVTGVVTNQHPNIKREDRDRINGILNYIKKYGAKSYLIKNKFDATLEALGILKNYLLGTVHYVMSINPELGGRYRNKLLVILERNF